jgi:hypothetical protein
MGPTLPDYGPGRGGQVGAPTMTQRIMREHLGLNPAHDAIFEEQATEESTPTGKEGQEANGKPQKEGPQKRQRLNKY